MCLVVKLQLLQRAKVASLRGTFDSFSLELLRCLRHGIILGVVNTSRRNNISDNEGQLLWLVPVQVHGT